MKKALSLKGSVPAGKSRGSGEAYVADFSDAKNSVGEIIKPHCVGNNFSTIREFDDYLIKLDGTADKKKSAATSSLRFPSLFAGRLPLKGRNWHGKSCAKNFLWHNGRQIAHDFC